MNATHYREHQLKNIYDIRIYIYIYIYILFISENANPVNMTGVNDCVLTSNKRPDDDRF